MKRLFPLILLAFLLVQCKNDTSTMKADESATKSDKGTAALRPLPEWAKQANIYEVNIRQYSPEGTFKAFAKSLPRLKAMGVDVLWLMPIFPISDTKKKGTLGSYYAVSDFKATNPEFGTKEDFDNMVDQAHSMGMKIILDWVPNHTGWDHVWIKQHPEYYTKDKDGNIVDPIDPGTGESWGWTDVADLNYDNQDMRKDMISDMLYWIENHDIDGFRMDVAHNVPNDFWKVASDAIFDAKPDVFMLAESETMDHVNNGYFHAIYGWAMHHMMNDIAKGEKNVDDLHNLLMEKKSEMKHGMFMHFTSNHDENSWAGTTEERMGQGADAFAVLAATFDGIPLVYGGQEEPLAKRLEFFEKDDIGFDKLGKANFYKMLLDLKHRNKALGNAENGASIVRIADHPYVYGFTKENDGDKVAVIVNLSNQKQEIRLTQPVTGLTDVLFGRRVEMGEGTIKSFDPWEFWIASNK